MIVIGRWVLILRMFAATPASLAAQAYEAPPFYDVHEPTGNTGLDTVAYEITASFYETDSPFRASATVTVKNGDENPKETINYYLHPELLLDAVRAKNGTDLQYETRKVEYWASTTLLSRETTVKLPSSLSPGDSIEVTLEYHGSINPSTARESRSDGYIGVLEDKVFLRSFAYTNWFPILHTTPAGFSDQADFRLAIEVPASLIGIAPGKLESEYVEGGRRHSVWSSLRPISLLDYEVFAESWKVVSEGPLRVFYHDDEGAARKYLEVCAKIKRGLEELYTADLPPEQVSAQYSVAQLDVPSGGYGAQNMVGFARKDFTGEYSFADLRWISHEMISEYIMLPLDDNEPGAMVIDDGFRLFFNLPVIERIAGADFKRWDLEDRWKRYEKGLAGGSDSEGPLPPEKPLVEITSEDYVFYKDRFLTADKEQIILWHLMDLVGEDAFLSGFAEYLKEHRQKPATIGGFRRALERRSGMDLREFFHRWFWTTERLPDEWRPTP